MPTPRDSSTIGALCVVFGLVGSLVVLCAGIREPSTQSNTPATRDTPFTDEHARAELASRITKPRYTGEFDALCAHYECERRHGRSVSRAFNATAALIRD